MTYRQQVTGEEDPGRAPEHVGQPGHQQEVFVRVDGAEQAVWPRLRYEEKQRRHDVRQGEVLQQTQCVHWFLVKK